MAPRVGFEPTTLRLTAGCSAVELPRNLPIACVHFERARKYYTHLTNGRKPLFQLFSPPLPRGRAAASGNNRSKRRRRAADKPRNTRNARDGSEAENQAEPRSESHTPSSSPHTNRLTACWPWFGSAEKPRVILCRGWALPPRAYRCGHRNRADRERNGRVRATSDRPPRRAAA